MTEKKNKTDIILIEKSWIIRTGLSVMLLEEFDKINVYEHAGDFDSFLSLVEMAGTCCVIINSEKINDMKQYMHRLPGHVIVIPLITNGLEQNHSEFEYSIGINEDKKVIINKILRATEPFANRIKNEMPLETLTKREQLILQLIAKGSSSKQIAEYLSISFNTVITHRKNISSKLDIKTVSGLTVYAILNNLIKADEANIK